MGKPFGGVLPISSDLRKSTFVRFGLFNDKSYIFFCKMSSSRDFAWFLDHLRHRIQIKTDEICNERGCRLWMGVGEGGGRKMWGLSVSLSILRSVSTPFLSSLISLSWYNILNLVAN